LLAFTISPTITLDTALVSDDENLDNGDQLTEPADSLSKIEWYSPPPINDLDALVSSPPAGPVPSTSPPAPANHFQLGMSLSYYDGTGNAETA
jgi:hypothetical protein